MIKKPWYNEQWLPKNFSKNDLIFIPPEMQWTSEMVELRMVDALRLLESTERDPRPEHIKSNWPKHTYDWSDLLAQAESPQDAKKLLKLRTNATCNQISEMEDVLTWQTRFLKEHPGALRVLNVFLKARAQRKSFSEEIRKMKWSRATAYRLKERALIVIAVGLMLEKVSPWK